MQKKTILVTGGAGFIGSYVNLLLQQAGYATVVLDNLSRGKKEMVHGGAFIEGNVGDLATLNKIFNLYRIDGVMHFAAWIDVGESVSIPLDYYQNNVGNTLNLLESMVKNKIQNLIFSSTAAIYGIPHAEKISEKHALNPINPYGKGKLMIENMLADFAEAYDLKYCSLRYFNAAGGDPTGMIKNKKPTESNLIPRTLRSILKPNEILTVYGNDYPTFDGTCIRDYIHIHDLAVAHIQALEKLLIGKPSAIYNLGTGHGYSVKQVIDATEKVTKRKVPFTIGPRREGDPPVLVADAAKAKEDLKWAPQYSLEQIIEHAWLALN